MVTPEEELKWLYSLRMKVTDQRAFKGIDVRQMHHWLWRRGFRPDPHMNRMWSNKRFKEDGRIIRFHIIDGNGYSDRLNRIADFVNDFAELYKRTPLQVLRELRETPPRDLLRPFFAVNDPVRLRCDQRVWLSPKEAKEAKSGSVGVVKRVSANLDRWIAYSVRLESGLTFSVRQTELEGAGVLDQMAHASK